MIIALDLPHTFRFIQLKKSTIKSPNYFKVFYNGNMNLHNRTVSCLLFILPRFLYSGLIYKNCKLKSGMIERYLHFIIDTKIFTVIGGYYPI